MYADGSCSIVTKKPPLFSGDGAKVIPIAIGTAKKKVFLGYRGKTRFSGKLDG
jgi:hypothetical protein